MVTFKRKYLSIDDIHKEYLPVSKKKIRCFVKKYLPVKLIGGRIFPEIKAFGWCHEIYGTQRTLVDLVKEKFGYEGIDRTEIKVNCLSVNHFTWLTEAKYRNIDLIPHFKEACDKYMEGEGVAIRETMVDDHWMNSHFSSGNMVKMDLFRRFGYTAAAGDRHLAEFCPGKWYLENPERVEEMHFELTTVKWRKDDLKNRLERAKKLISGGGTVTADTAALEDRIVLAMPSCSMCAFKDSIGATTNCTCNYVPHIAEYFDMGDLMAMAAPKYFVQVSGIEDDGFPLFAAEDVFEKGEKAYEKLGVSNRCTLVKGNGGHRFYADDAWPFVHEYIGK